MTKAGKDGQEKRTTRNRQRTVVVIGAGRMGADIALAFAIGGWDCEVVETAAAMRERATRYWSDELARLRAKSRLKCIRLHADLGPVNWAAADLVIEALPEKLALKQRFMARLEPLIGAATLVVSNTSSLRIKDVMQGMQRPGRCAGLHFMVPAHVMLVVELTQGPATSAATVRKLKGWLVELGKVPVVLTRDVPGMLINRIQHAMYREIYHLIDSGAVKPEDVDRAVRFGFGFRFQYAGPVVSRDIHGLPVHLETARKIVPTLYNGKKPGALLRRLVADGHHGVRTGRGFYKWDMQTVDGRLAHFSQLMEEAFARVRKRGEPTEF